MDLICQPITCTFTLTVGHFDTILKIKEQIQKEHGIPVSAQTLVFNGDVLDDELQLSDSDIIHLSHIQLIIAPDPEKRSTKLLDHSQPIDVPNPRKRSINTKRSSSVSKKVQLRMINTKKSSSNSKKVRLPIKKRGNNPEKHRINTEESSTHFKNIVLRFKMPSSESPLAIQMATNDTIRSLKERLQAIVGNPMSRFILRANGIKLQDDKSIHDSALHHLSEIEVIEPLMVFIKICDANWRIRMMVNTNDEVAELRKKLDKLNQDLELDLPPGFFFIHKQRVMDDDLSFRWHCVKEDDIIVYLWEMK